MASRARALLLLAWLLQLRMVDGSIASGAREGGHDALRAYVREEMARQRDGLRSPSPPVFSWSSAQEPVTGAEAPLRTARESYAPAFELDSDLCPVENPELKQSLVIPGDAFAKVFGNADAQRGLARKIEAWGAGEEMPPAWPLASLTLPDRPGSFGPDVVETSASAPADTVAEADMADEAKESVDQREREEEEAALVLNPTAAFIAGRRPRLGPDPDTVAARVDVVRAAAAGLHERDRHVTMLTSSPIAQPPLSLTEADIPLALPGSEGGGTRSETGRHDAAALTREETEAAMQLAERADAVRVGAEEAPVPEDLWRQQLSDAEMLAHQRSTDLDFAANSSLTVPALAAYALTVRADDAEARAMRAAGLPTGFASTKWVTRPSRGQHRSPVAVQAPIVIPQPETEYRERLSSRPRKFLRTLVTPRASVAGEGQLAIADTGAHKSTHQPVRDRYTERQGGRAVVHSALNKKAMEQFHRDMRGQNVKPMSAAKPNAGLLVGTEAHPAGAAIEYSSKDRRVVRRGGRKGRKLGGEREAREPFATLDRGKGVLGDRGLWDLE